MAKAIINKHIDSADGVVLSKKFDTDVEKRKGEILICNDPDNPTIYIMDNTGKPQKITGGEGGSGSGESYDDKEIWEQVNKNTKAIDEIRKTGVNNTIPQDIIVAGLEDEFGAGNYENGDVIKAGTDIYTILQNFLCKELYPTNTVKSTKATATAKMNNLSLALSHSGTIEVGTLVRLTKGETAGSSVSKTDSSITGMTYGYSYENDGTQDSKDTSITKTCSTNIDNNNYLIETQTMSGFDADKVNNLKTIPAPQTGTGKAALNATDLGCVIEGNNEIIISATGASYSYSADKIDRVYYCSNLGKTDATHYHDGVAAVNGTTAHPTKTAKAEITGAFYYFLGYSTNTTYDQFDSDSIRGLDIRKGWVNSKNDTTIVSSDIVTSTGESIVIACPSTYELKTINYSNQADMLSKFSSSGEVDVKTGEINTKYNVYVYPITNDAKVEFTNVSIGKK